MARDAGACPDLGARCMPQSAARGGVTVGSLDWPEWALVPLRDAAHHRRGRGLGPATPGGEGENDVPAGLCCSG